MYIHKATLTPVRSRSPRKGTRRQQSCPPAHPTPLVDCRPCLHYRHPPSSCTSMGKRAHQHMPTVALDLAVGPHAPLLGHGLRAAACRVAPCCHCLLCPTRLQPLCGAHEQGWNVLRAEGFAKQPLGLVDGRRHALEDFIDVGQRIQGRLLDALGGLASLLLHVLPQVLLQLVPPLARGRKLAVGMVVAATVQYVEMPAKQRSSGETWLRGFAPELRLLPRGACDCQLPRAVDHCRCIR